MLAERILITILFVLFILGGVLSVQELSDTPHTPVVQADVHAECPPCPLPVRGACVQGWVNETRFICSARTGFHCEALALRVPCTAGERVVLNVTVNESVIPFETRVPETLAMYYAAKPRLPTGDYAYYATSPFDAPVLLPLVDQARVVARALGMPVRDVLIRLVQELPYTPDALSPADEYPKFPVETLLTGGDCEDTAILLARLLVLANESVALVRLPGHMAVAVPCERGNYVWENASYCYVETTDPWPIGMIPASYARAPAEFLPVTPKPFLQVEWHAELVREEHPIIRVGGVVWNNGSLAARNVRIRVLAEAREEGKAYAVETVRIPRLPVDAAHAWNVSLRVPWNVATRVRVVYEAENAPWQESLSQWIQTS